MASAPQFTDNNKAANMKKPTPSPLNRAKKTGARKASGSSKMQPPRRQKRRVVTQNHAQSGGPEVDPKHMAQLEFKPSANGKQTGRKRRTRKRRHRSTRRFQVAPHIQNNHSTSIQEQNRSASYGSSFVEGITAPEGTFSFHAGQRVTYDAYDDDGDTTMADAAAAEGM